MRPAVLALFSSLTLLSVVGCSSAPVEEEAEESDEGALAGGMDATNVPAVGYLAYAPAVAQRLDARDPAAPEGPLDAKDARVGTCNGATATMRDGTLNGSTARLQGALCTATLISPNVVVTLARCVLAPGAMPPRPIADLAFGVGDTARPRLVKVSKVEAHPEYAPAMGTTPAQHDIAVVVLAEGIYDVKPLTLAKRSHLGRCDYVSTSYNTSVGPDGSCLASRKAANFCVDKGLANGSYMKAYSDRAGFCKNDVGAALRVANTSELVAIQAEVAGQACAVGTPGLFFPVANYSSFLEGAISRYTPSSDGH